jgi:hypothetical protein
MTIVESRPDELVRIKLEFPKPFAATNTAEFTFKPEGERTAVTWSMYGHNSFVSRAVFLFVNMDQALGGEFEKGLASMKSVAEASAKEIATPEGERPSPAMAASEERSRI